MSVDMLDRKAFAERLKHARMRSGYTREEAASRVNISHRTLAAYEIGRFVPLLDTFVSLCRIYKTSPVFLIFGEVDVYDEDISAEYFIRNMYKIRVRRGMSQATVGELAASCQGAISNYESGQSIPTVETALWIAWALDTDFSYMLGRI